jgi:hypothetical protein
MAPNLSAVLLGDIERGIQVPKGAEMLEFSAIATLKQQRVRRR